MHAKRRRRLQIQLIRKYTGFSAFSKTEADKLDAWLQKEAERQFHLVDLINEAIFHLKEILVELPAFQHLVRLGAHAIKEADRKQKELLSKSLSAEQKEKLDSVLQSECRYQRTPFYELKAVLFTSRAKRRVPPKNPSAKAIIKEIQLLDRLRSFNISFDVLKQINFEKIKHFFEIAKSYKSNELSDLKPKTRYPILICFIYMRIKEVTDNIVELLFRLWNKVTRKAEKAQNEYVLARDEIKLQSESLSEQLLEIIVESSSKDEIVDRIFDLHSYEEYKWILEMIRRFKRPKKERYFQALSSRYSFLRRFTPLLWEKLIFRSNTSNDTLIQAISFLKENLEPSIPELPVEGAPKDFVPDNWDKYVFIRQRVTRKVLSINKSMYELCIIEQLIARHLIATLDVASPKATNHQGGNLCRR